MELLAWHGGSRAHPCQGKGLSAELGRGSTAAESTRGPESSGVRGLSLMVLSDLWDCPEFSSFFHHLQSSSSIIYKHQAVEEGRGFSSRAVPRLATLR